MAFSLSKWFKGSSTAPESAPAQDKPTVTVAAPPASLPRITQRPQKGMTRTVPAVRKVVPNSVQPVSLRDPSARPVQLPVSVPPPAPGPRPKISFGASSPSGAPAAVAAEPLAFPIAEQYAAAEVPDMVVNLELGDFLDRIPANLLAAGAIDRQLPVQFHSTELYSDLTKGRASVPASVIYKKCPELFAHPVTETEDAEVMLPLAKLVEQMSPALQTRVDQLAEENVGEIETPFLQVAMEDNARLVRAGGSGPGAVRPAVAAVELPPRPPHRSGQIQAISPVKAAPEAPALPAAPTAASAGPIMSGKRPPSTVRASVAGGKIRLSGPSMPSRISAVNPGAPAGVRDELPPSESQMISVASASSPSHQVAKKTARIQIPPISLRTAGSSAAPSRTPAPPSAPTPSAVPNIPPGVPSVPLPSVPTPMRSNPGGESVHPPISFRLSPPPPSAKTMPHSFAPPPRPSFPPPAFPVVPPMVNLPGAPLATPPPPTVAPVSLPPAPPVLPPRANLSSMPPVFAPAPAAAPAPADERRITLGLGAVLRGLSASLLAVDPSSVADDVRIDLPFAMVEPQLSTGRVSVPRATFLQALPESHRAVLDADADLPEIPLPLQEVFQNLPSNALTIRADQVTQKIAPNYPTPFSQKAEEDAQRLGAGNVPAAPPAAEVPPAAVGVPAPESAGETPAAELSVDRQLPADETTAGAATPVEEPPVEGSPAPIDNEDVENSVAAEHTMSRDIPLDLEDIGEHAPLPSASEPAAEIAASAVEGEATCAIDEAPVEIVAEETEAHFEVGNELAAGHEAATAETNAEVVAPECERPLEPVVEPVQPEPVARPEPKAEFLDHPLTPPVVPVVRTRHTDAGLQGLFMTEEVMDAKTVVKLVSQLPGLTGCAVMFGDGLRLAGNFPAEAQTEGFSAMAPPFFKRARNFAHEAQIGNLKAFTIFTDAEPLSFFMCDDICVSVRHAAGRGFLPGVREKLEIVVRELARMYSSAPTDESQA